MAYYHGIKTSEVPTSLATPAEIATGITFAVGTAPVHLVGGENVNKLVYAGSYAEAVGALGNSDDWKKWTLCEVIDTHFVLYGVKPVVFVNVFDPKKHRKAVEAANFTFADGAVALPGDALADSVIVKSEDKATTYAEGTDYTLIYDEDKLIIEKTEGSTISGTAVSVEYYEADPSMVTADDIIGGISATTGEKSGLELLNSVYPKYNIVPEFVIAPGFSDNSALAAIMDTKASSINGLFKGKAIIDADCSTVRKYCDVYGWKSSNNISGVNQIVCWPMLALGGKAYHYSSHYAALAALIDTENGGFPSRSPSNKALKADSTVLADGSEIIIEHAEANVLNSNGIVTATNLAGRFVSWGNETACYPANTDVKDYFVNINRMFGYLEQYITLTFWTKIDENMTRRLLDTIVDSINIQLNSLKTAGHLLGGRIEFSADDNAVTDLMAGKAKFHLYVTPPSPAKELHYELEYDVEYVKAALAG